MPTAGYRSAEYRSAGYRSVPVPGPESGSERRLRRRREVVVHSSDPGSTVKSTPPTARPALTPLPVVATESPPNGKPVWDVLADGVGVAVGDGKPVGKPVAVLVGAGVVLVVGRPLGRPVGKPEGVLVGVGRVGGGEVVTQPGKVTGN
jgi:hypothetical protein